MRSRKIAALDRAYPLKPCQLADQTLGSDVYTIDCDPRVVLWLGKKIALHGKREWKDQRVFEKIHRLADESCALC
jgi:hypothetical protein